MAVRIRLTRRGAKKAPVYRVIVADSRSPRDGRFIESIGFYDPTADPPRFTLKKDRYDYWIKVGAQPSAVVKSLVGRYAP